MFLISVEIASSATQPVKEMLISPSGRLMREERRTDNANKKLEETASGDGAQAQVDADASDDDDSEQDTHGYKNSNSEKPELFFTGPEIDDDSGEKQPDTQSQQGHAELEAEDGDIFEAAQQVAPKIDGRNNLEEGDSSGDIRDISVKNEDDDDDDDDDHDSDEGVFKRILLAKDGASSESGLNGAGTEVKADTVVKADEENLIVNGDFQSGTTGWMSACPADGKNGHGISGHCSESGVWTKVPESSHGSDSKAYHIKAQCYNDTKGGFYQDFKTEIGITYHLTYHVIDGWFEYKNAGAGQNWSLSYVEIQSPQDFPVADMEFRSTTSATDPKTGGYEAAGPFEFIAGGKTSRIYFYAGPGSCANIDDVRVVKTQAPKLNVYPLSQAILDGRIEATEGSFKDHFSSPAMRPLRILSSTHANTVNLYPSFFEPPASADTQYNELDVDLPSWTHGGCSHIAGSAKLHNAPGTRLMQIQMPRGSDVVFTEVGAGGVVFSPSTDDSPMKVRLRILSESDEYDNSATLEAKIFFYCHSPSRENWTLNTFHFGHGLCLSVAASDAQDNEFGCHDLTCRGNIHSDATLQPCDTQTWSQSFYLDLKDNNTGFIRSASKADRCLEVDDSVFAGKDKDCLPLTLSICDAARAQQQFSKAANSSSKIVQLKAYQGRFLSVMQASHGAPAYDQWVQACKAHESKVIDSFALSHSDIDPQTGAEDVPSQPLAEAGPLISDVWAEAICPWFFNPPVTSGSRNMKCYDSTLCEEEGCCDGHGGTFLCSAEKPYMCEGPGVKSYACKASQDECTELGGRRKCEGPPGTAGRDGLMGPAGMRGEAGRDGAPGREGPKGDAGTSNSSDQGTSNSTGGVLLQTHTKESWLEEPASVADGAGALIINLFVCSVFYASLKAKVRSLGTTAGASVAQEGAAQEGVDVAGSALPSVAGSVPPSAPPSLPASSAPPSAPPSVPAGSAPPSAPPSEAGEQSGAAP